MARDLFSVPIFFIARLSSHRMGNQADKAIQVFRETLEASIIVSVLLALAEQIVLHVRASGYSTGATTDQLGGDTKVKSSAVETLEDQTVMQKRLIRKMRWQIFSGAALGLLIALAIGAAFIAVWFTEAKDIWSQSEDLWEGIFSLVASILIFIMGVTMLRMDRAKAKWRVKLSEAFNERARDALEPKSGKGTKYALFILPLVTVLREGLEAVVFVGGVSLGEPASSIPIAAIVGLICGVLVGIIIWFFGHRLNISIFLVVSTALLLLIGAGLFSKAVGDFEAYRYIKLIGSDADDAGDGPGTYDVRGNVWHLTYGNPENTQDGQGWSIFNAIFGWNNNATIGSILSYVFYWLAVIACLIYMKWEEGRMTFFGRQSKTYKRRAERRLEGPTVEGEREGSDGKDEMGKTGSGRSESFKQPV